MEGQKQADISKMRLKDEGPLFFRAYVYKIKKPSAKVYKVNFNGIQSSLAFTYSVTTDILLNNVIPNNVLIGRGIIVPKTKIKNVKRKAKDLSVRRETEDALGVDQDYDKMRKQEKLKNKWINKLNNR